MKIHALADAKGRLIAILLSGGEAHDCPLAERLIRRVKSPGRLLGDKAYDSTELRAAGITSPSHEQLDVLGSQALQTAILGTPWGKRYQHLAPGQRRTFRDLVDGWSAMIESRVRAQLGEPEEEIAA